MPRNTAQATFERLKRVPLDFTQIDYLSFEMEGVDRRDYPEFCDAHVLNAEFIDGSSLTDDQLGQLNAESDIVYEAACSRRAY